MGKGGTYLETLLCCVGKGVDCVNLSLYYC